MAGNEIGNVKSVRGTSMNLNTQDMGNGAGKPNPQAGTSNPGGAKPPKPADKMVPMPK